MAKDGSDSIDDDIEKIITKLVKQRKESAIFQNKEEKI